MDTYYASFSAITYTVPNEDHEEQYGVDIVSQNVVQKGENGLCSNIGPAIHAWYGQLEDSSSRWGPKRAEIILQREGWCVVGTWTPLKSGDGYTARIERRSTPPRR